MPAEARAATLAAKILVKLVVIMLKSGEKGLVSKKWSYAGGGQTCIYRTLSL
jgi:hypothetical protein